VIESRTKEEVLLCVVGFWSIWWGNNDFMFNGRSVDGNFVGERAGRAIVGFLSVLDKPTKGGSMLRSWIPLIQKNFNYLFFRGLQLYGWTPPKKRPKEAWTPYTQLAQLINY